MEIMEIVQMKRRKSARPITHMITMIVADFFFEKNDETYWFQASDKVTQVLRYVRRTLAATSSIEDPVRCGNIVDRSKIPCGNIVGGQGENAHATVRIFWHSATLNNSNFGNRIFF